jgi:hypothetical protein
MKDNQYFNFFFFENDDIDEREWWHFYSVTRFPPRGLKGDRVEHYGCLERTNRTLLSLSEEFFS